MRPGSRPASSKVLASIARAMDLMHYDVGFLSGEEADTLARHGVTPPSWQRTASTPFSVITTAAGDRIGFLRFPSLPPDRDKPREAMLEQLVRDIRKYRPEVRLLVGLSDWGWLAEQKYLARNPEAVPDLLLGSGKGSGVNGRIQADGRCLWVRTYDKGRSIAEIAILEWPDRENSFAWNPSRNYKTSSIGLNDRIKDYPAVRDALE